MAGRAVGDVAILGAGSMGTALAQVAASNGHTVRAWSIEADVLDEIGRRHTNSRYTGDVPLHPNIEPEGDLTTAVRGASLVAVAVPSQVVATVARQAAPCLEPTQTVLNAAKGLQTVTLRRMSQVLRDELGPRFEESIASLGGPAIAIEMAQGQSVAVIVGATGEGAAARVQAIFHGERCKVETTSDIAGVELCGAIKNVYAILLGICDGLGYGANTKAFIATLALQEMAAICQALGGRRETVYGLAGLGDLLATGYSPHSRNRTLGEKLALGLDWREFLRTHPVEGIAAADALRRLTATQGLETPLLDALNAVLSGEMAPAGVLRSLFEAHPA